ncbi:DMT family transporter [Aureimonas phyllosphaerae]|uniref:Drug/metabolite transporter (DMT)-like permease n=1 Tax=Aureimonas phyllosphaerae TaxID=1166078 RepID=A0A7W6BSY6_9HYPH|nr:DMT family transporter [Aureimonas phyllosphaerae]MBB3935484.1 drug/metabolite transporter (DMT)-like permease [Aureimonas phyllosphaerae]MBB3959492.1 drug/metabolite transporter (DMT)-like permease [Aureimonas phyllosphaerae]
MSSASVRFASLGANLQASILMTLSMATFATNDMLTKFATQSIEPVQIMAVRGVMASLLLFLFARWRKAALSFSVLREPAVLVRAFADICTTLTYLNALRHLPLANTAAIFQALPLTITLGAFLFLGESVGWRRWTAIAVGFAGVLVILAPGVDGFNVYGLWVLASVVFAAMRDLATRRMPPNLSSPQIALVTSIAVTLTGFAFLPVVGWRPMSGSVWIILVFASMTLACGYALIVAAVRLGEMSFVAPFRYTILLFSIILGMLAFGERPTARETLGSLIVVGSGLYTLHREARRRPASSAA